MHMIRTSAEYNDGPISFRYPRGEGIGIEPSERGVYWGKEEFVKRALGKQY